jgi:hypothetical protein
VKDSYSEYLDGIEQNDQLRFTDGVQMSVEKDTARRLQAEHLANVLGEQDVDYVEAHYNRLDRDARNRGLYNRLPENSPTRQILANPNEYALQPDAENLAKVESYTSKIANDIAQSTEFGAVMQDAGNRSFNIMWEDPDTYRKKMAPYDQAMGDLEGREADLNWISQLPGDVAEFVGQYSGILTESSVWIPTGLAAIAETFVARGKSTSYPGTKAVMSMSAGKEMFEMETGMAYRDFIDLVGPDGKSIEPDVARGAALLVGAINGGLEFIGAGILIKLAGAGRWLKALDKPTIKTLLNHPGFGKALKRVAGAYAAGVAAEGLQEALQEISQISMEYALTGKVDPNAPDQIFQAWSQGTRVGMAFGIGGATVGTMEARKVQTESERRTELFTALGETASETNVLENAPSKFKEFVQAVKDKHGQVKSIFVDPEAARTFFQEVDSEMLANDMPETYASLKENEGNPAAYVEIPLEEFVTHVAPSMDFTTLVDDMTFDPGVPTPRQAKEANAQAEALLKEYNELANQEDAAVDRTDDPLYGRVYADLLLTGRDPEVADKEATIFSRMITLRAQSAQMDPIEYFNHHGISIRAEIETAQGELDVPSYFGGLLNMLRDGRGPAQRDIFGPSVIEFLMGQGGINEFNELAARDLDKAQANYGKKSLARETGLDMTGAFEAARDAGYLELGDSASEEIALLDAIDRELGGQRVYAPGMLSPEEHEIAMAIEHLESEIDRLGLDLNEMTNGELLDELGLNVFEQASGRRLQQELSAWERVGNLDNLKEYEPEAYAAVESFLSRIDNSEAARIRDNLSEFAGTAWAASAVKGMVIREGMYMAWEGKDPADLYNLGMWGKKPLTKYKMYQALSRGKEGIKLFASGYKFVGGNRKAEQDFSGSYANCNPSRACATHCYAARGTSYNTALMSVEFTEFMAEMDPEMLADSIATQFEMSAPGQGGLALRVNEKGDLSEAQLNLIQKLNDKGIRIQIFSKRPDLLERTDETNLRMLSIDDTNLDLADANPDLQLAVVVTPEITQDWVAANNERVAVYLPVKLGNSSVSEADLKAAFPDEFDSMRKNLCPVDGGRKSVPEKGTSYVQIGSGKGKLKDVWTCTACDNYGSAGCFHGDRQTEVNQFHINNNSDPGIDGAMADTLESLRRLYEAGGLSDARYRSILTSIRDGVSVNEGDPVRQAAAPDRPSPATRSEAHGENKPGTIEVAEADLIPVRTLYQRAYHGDASPQPHDKFEVKYIGAGEGNQIYGWGLYFAQLWKTAQQYQDARYNERSQSGWLTDSSIREYMGYVADIDELRTMMTSRGFDDHLTSALEMHLSRWEHPAFGRSLPGNVVSGTVNTPEYKKVVELMEPWDNLERARFQGEPFSLGELRSREHEVRMALVDLVDLVFKPRLEAHMRGSQVGPAVASAIADMMTHYDVLSMMMSSHPDGFDDYVYVGRITSQIDGAIDDAGLDPGIADQIIENGKDDIEKLGAKLKEAWEEEAGTDRSPIINDEFDQMMVEFIEAHVKPILPTVEGQVERYVYQVNVPEDNELLYYDVPLSQQPDEIKAILTKSGLMDGGVSTRFNLQWDEFNYAYNGHYNYHHTPQAVEWISENAPELGPALDRIALDDEGYYPELVKALNMSFWDSRPDLETPHADHTTWDTDTAREVLKAWVKDLTELENALAGHLSNLDAEGLADSGNLLSMEEGIGSMATALQGVLKSVPPTPREILGGAPETMTPDKGEELIGEPFGEEGRGTEAVIVYPKGYYIEVLNDDATRSMGGRYYVTTMDWDGSTNTLAEAELILGKAISDETEIDDYFGDPTEGGHVTGREFYNDLPNHPIADEWIADNDLGFERSDKQASLFLNSLGIPGLKFRDGWTRSKKGDYTHNYVIWNDDALRIDKVNQKKRRLYQATRRLEEPKTRGYLDIGQGSHRITLTKDADLSTFIHETGHLMLELMQADIQQGRATDEMKRDFAVITQYLTDNAPGERVDGLFTTDQHELFARSLEAYFYEGNAPSSELAVLYKRFKEWMKSTYASLKKLNAPLSDEVRDVFDRMIAGDEAVKAVTEELVNPEFSPFDAETQSNLEALHDQAVQAGLDDIQDQIRRELARRKKADYQARKKQLRLEIADELDQEPVYAVQNLLRKGVDNSRDIPEGIAGKKLDTKAIKRIFADGKVLRRIVGLYQKNGLDPKYIADLYGFTSAENMIQQIIAQPSRGDALKQRVNTQLESEFGNLNTDTEIIERAALAMHSTQTESLIVAEADAAAKKLGGRAGTTLNAAAKEAARLHIAGMPLMKILPNKFYQAEQRSSKEAQKAAGKGDMAEMLKHKRLQLLNHHLYREAVAARDKAERMRKEIDRMTKPKSLRWRKSAPDLAAAIELLVSAYEFKRVPLRVINARAALRDQVEQVEAAGGVIVLPPDLYSTRETRNYKQLTLDELTDIRDQIKTWAKEGRDTNKMRLEGKQVSIDTLVTELGETIEQNVSKKKTVERLVDPTGRFARLGMKIRELVASLRKVEFLCREADGMIGGRWFQSIFQPFVAAQNARDTRLMELDRQVKQIMDTLSKDDAERLSGKVTFLGYEDMRKSDLYMVALQMGNQGNIDRLVKGYGWTERGVIDALQDHLTVEDFQRVEALGKLVDSFYPEMARVSERVDGIVPPKVEGKPVFLPKLGITLTGWYYPVKYKDVQGTPERQATVEQAIEMGPSPLSGQISKSMTKSRAEGTPAGKIDLNFHGFGSHINQVVHYITHYETIRNFDRLRMDAGFRKVFEDHFGPELYKELRSWGQNIATDGRLSQTSHAATNTWNDLAAHVRTGYSMVALGWDIVGAMKQTLGLASSAAILGPGAVARSLLIYIGEGTALRAGKNPDSRYAIAVENSPELQNMNLQIDRDIREITKGNLANVARKPAGVGATTEFYWDQVAAYSFSFIATIQKQVNAVTWSAAYEKAVGEGMGDQEAINYADGVVRQTQSGGGLKDLAGVQQSKSELIRGATMFITWGIVVYNQMIRTGRQDLVRGFIKGEGGRTAGALRFANTIGWFVVASAILDQLIFGDEEEDELPMAIAANIASTAAFGIPGVRDVVSGLAGFSASTPMTRMVDDVADLFNTDISLDDAYGIASTLTAITHLPFRAAVEITDALTQEEWSEKITSLLTGVPYEQRLEGLD